MNIGNTTPGGGISTILVDSSTMAGDGVATPLAAKDQGGLKSISVDGVTVTGNGISTPLVANIQTPVLGANLIPKMTSNTAPSGVASASSNYSTNVAFYGMTDAQVGWLSASGQQVNAWLKYDFGAGNAQIVRSYGFAPWSNDNYGQRSPSAWKLQGSNDDTNWTDLDSRASSVRGALGLGVYQTYRAPWSLIVMNVTTPGSYRYYRVLITAVNGGTYAGIVDLRLMAEAMVGV